MVTHGRDIRKGKTVRNTRWLQNNRCVNLIRGTIEEFHRNKEMNGFITLQTATVSTLSTAAITVQGYKRNITPLSLITKTSRSKRQSKYT